ncbi:MAG: chitobiase/beta-hexosaminidase C-terminal domain-containing protein, partial [Fibrobacterota bacterium]
DDDDDDGLDLLRPSADPSQGLLFADDSVRLFLDGTDDFDTLPDYRISYYITYDNDETDVIMGEINTDASVYVEDFIDRHNRDARDFRISASTAFLDEAGNIDQYSRASVFDYEIRKLFTAPHSSQYEEFTRRGELAVSALDRHSEAGDLISPARRVYGEIHGERNGDAFVHEAFENEPAMLEFYETTDFMFWAEDSRYISSDTVQDNQFRLVPDISISPADGSAFGDFLEVTIESNITPFYYTINEEFTHTVEDNEITFRITEGDPAPGDSVEISLRAWVPDSEKGERNLTYYRRKLSAVDIQPESGGYAGDIPVSMKNPIGADSGTVYYTSDAIPQEDDTPYTGDFAVRADTTLSARAYVRDGVVDQYGVGGWLPSDTGRVDYWLLAGYDRAAYYDVNADGMIDSAEIYLDTVFDDLTIPDSIHAFLPETQNYVTVSKESDISFDAYEGKIEVSISGLNEINTGFPAGEYLQAFGERYSPQPVQVDDSIAPVVIRARYVSGEFSDSKNSRDQDTLIAYFSESVPSLGAGAPDRENLFYFGSSDDYYTANITYYDRDERDSVFTFTVDELHDRLYPSKDDSLWIQTNIPLVIADGGENIQNNPDNRRVPLLVGELRILLTVDAFWIDENPAFRTLENYKELGTPLGGEDFRVALGGAIIIDPGISFTEDQVRSTDDFDAQITIIDPVGNVVAAADGRNDSQTNIEVVPVLMNTSDGSQRYVLAVLWDGYNTRGRKAGPGSYKISGSARIPFIDRDLSIQGVIPLMKAYEPGTGIKNPFR